MSDNRSSDQAGTHSATVISTRATIIDVGTIVLTVILAGGVVANAVRGVAIPSELAVALASVVSYYFGARTRRDFGG